MITKIDLKEIPGRACSYNTAVSNEVEEFYKSGWDACEVKTNKYKTSHSAYAAYNTAIKRLRLNVMVFERSVRVFMARKEAI